MDEIQKVTQARGDLSVVALSAIRTASQQAQVRLLTTVGRLQKLKLPMTTEDGKPTIANVLLSEFDVINQSLSDIFAIANTVTLEMDALAEQHNVGRSITDVVADVVSMIKQSNPAYAHKTEQEIRQEFGL